MDSQVSKHNERMFTVPYVAPIPVGHRVEVLFFIKTGGVFKKKETLEEKHPLIRDLDSGIEYGSYWHYKKMIAMSEAAYTPEEYPLPLRPELEVGRKIIGMVTHCRVLTEAFGTIWKGQTTLQIKIT